MSITPKPDDRTYTPFNNRAEALEVVEHFVRSKLSEEAGVEFKFNRDAQRLEVNLARPITEINSTVNAINSRFARVSTFQISGADTNEAAAATKEGRAVILGDGVATLDKFELQGSVIELLSLTNRNHELLKGLNGDQSELSGMKRKLSELSNRVDFAVFLNDAGEVTIQSETPEATQRLYEVLAKRVKHTPIEVDVPNNRISIDNCGLNGLNESLRAAAAQLEGPAM